MLILKYRRALRFGRSFAVGCALLLVGFSPSVIGATCNIRLAIVENHNELPSLDDRRLFALGMIETGNDDCAIGRAGEISRYQLSPPVWKNYSRSREYRNPDVSLRVAQLHWNYLASYFKEKTGRLPSDFDMYVMWNTRYGYYCHKHFSRNQISLVVQDRAQRFVNLVNRKV